MIVWDTEFTSWEGCNENGWDESEGQYKELLQIGGFKISENDYTIIDSIDIVLKPRINDELSEYIQNLTGISQSVVEERGVDFVEALDEFEDFCNYHERYSWGNDVDILNYNIDLYECERSVRNQEMYNDIREVFESHGIPHEEYTSGSVYTHYDIDAKIDQHYAVEDSLSMVLALQKASNSR